MSVLVSDRDSPSGAVVRTLTLSRPERRNALDPDTLAALQQAVLEAAATDEVRALVFAGAGKAFCAGYDLRVPFPQDDRVPDALVVRAMAAVRDCPLPTVARLHGPAFGAGLELAISCDVRVASDAASFCLPPARLGIAYAPEGLSRLAQLVGTSKARLMAFTGRPVTAPVASSWGLVDELVPSEALDEAVNSLADTMADAAPLAVRAMKKTFNRLEASLSKALYEEAEHDRLACYASDDAREGVRAFGEKRPAKFTGR